MSTLAPIPARPGTTTLLMPHSVLRGEFGVYGHPDAAGAGR